MKQTRLFFALMTLAAVALPTIADEAGLLAENRPLESQQTIVLTEAEEPAEGARCEEPKLFAPEESLREFAKQQAQVCGLCPPLNDCGGCAVIDSTCIFVDTGQRTCDLATSQQPPCGATCPPGKTLHFQQCDCEAGCGIAVTKRSLQCF